MLLLDLKLWHMLLLYQVYVEMVEDEFTEMCRESGGETQHSFFLQPCVLLPFIGYQYNEE